MAIPVPINKVSWGGLVATSASAAQTQAAAPRQYAVVVGCAGHATTDPNIITVANSGTALTWTQIADHIYSTGANPRLRIMAWIADISTGISAQTITVASSGAASVAGNLSVWQDIDPTILTNVAYADNAAGDPSITLATVGSDSAVIYGAYGVGGIAFTFPTGYTELADALAGTARQITVGYDNTSPATTLTFASTNTYTTAFALEFDAVQYAQIDTTGQTRFGDMTGLGGLVSAFDGVTNAVASASATKTITNLQNAYAGTRLAAAEPIGKVTLYGTSNQGYVNIWNSTTTWDIYGKAGADPANSTDGTLLATLTFNDTSNESVGRDFLVPSTTPYDRIWGRLTHGDTTGRVVALTEMLIFEPLSVVTGNLTVQETGSDTLDATGTVETGGPPDLTGTLVVQETGADTSAATGTVPITGTLGVAETGADTLASPGGKVAVAGTLAVAESGSDTSTITGTVPVVGALAVTESGSDTAAVSAQLYVTGNFVATETGADTASALGTVPVTGTLVVQEVGSDTCFIDGRAPGVAGSLTAQEAGVDTAAVTGTVAIAGTLVVQEVGSDVAAIVGGMQPGVIGNLVAAETGADTAAATGTLGPVPVTGNLAVSETGSDSAALIGTVSVAGNLVAAETGADTAAIVGTRGPLPVSGTLVAQETGADTAAGSGKVSVAGALTAQESGADTAAGTGALGALNIGGALAVTEVGSDSASLTGKVLVSGSLTAAEVGADTLAASGTVPIAASLAATEQGKDNASISGGVAITGTMAVQEVGADTCEILVRTNPPKPNVILGATLNAPVILAGRRDDVVQLHGSTAEMIQLKGEYRPMVTLRGERRTMVTLKGATRAR